MQLRMTKWSEKMEQQLTTRKEKQPLRNQAEQSARLVDHLLRWRYLLAAVIFILLVAFKVHGSSLNMWDAYVSEYADGQKSSLIAGEPRGVRSDEWLVQTPFSLSQTQTGLKTHNDVITLNGQDMVVGYNSPAWNLATLAKPFTWGYVLLGKEYGLSWYWNLKLIGLILFSFEIGLIVTRRNKYLALLASVWIPFSSALQWWFVSPVGDLVFFGLGFLVGIYNYFYYHSSVRRRVICAITAVIMASGFVLVIYPALQVPFGYLILLFLILFFLEFRKKIKLDKWDGVLIGGALLMTAIIVGGSLYGSLDSLKAVMDTAYPGKRVSLGGDMPKRDILLFLTNWKMPFQDVPYSNNSEISSFYQLFFVILPLSPFIFYKKIKENIYGFVLFVYCLFNLVWMSVQFPTIFAKLTLWSYVPEQRAMLSFGFAAVLLSLWFIDYLWNRQAKIPMMAWLGALGLNVVLYFFVLYTGNLRLYVTRMDIIGVLVVATVLIVALFKRWRTLFVLVLLGIIMVSGAFVNPISRGVSAVYGKKLAVEVEEINKKDPNQLWVGERLMYGYLPMLGVHTFNGVAFTPDLEAWKPLDPKGKDTFIYNRYAHINVEVGNQTPVLELMQKDAIIARLSPEKLKEYGIKYAVVYKPLEPLDTPTIHFEKLYGPDQNGAYIYRIND
ncbi:DUF7657 domain-containing protein [Enterococcus faecalis]|uniref:DUF7657 domain-containing protein n=1 Tax=Enterococcus TaxID=1350 RepID=UPI0013E921FB|nr:hypothetical protein [Enterococcus faecalis]EGO2576990.1 hypothetical protein [Enterococcus faecalis]EGO7505612.1 hypothetical protein [Enterococcus faecalis]EIT2192270.1 hypothetical protein [Enterococcus faecalis]EIY5963946.1 hypothetical protein [Enterococcus faecalis]EKZ0174546.1 hypothetical protein [Enterococcus faecalis]